MDHDEPKQPESRLTTLMSRRQAAKLLGGGALGMASIAASSQPAAALRMASGVRRNDTDANPWIPVSGKLTAISAGSATDVWGCNSAGRIYTYTGGPDGANPWRQVGGSLSAISVAADGAVWGCNSADNIYRYVPS